MDPVSATVLLAARWALIVLTVVLVLLMTYIGCLRGLLLLRERRYRGLAARWTPILLGGGRSEPQSLPGVHPKERFLLLILWNALREQHEQDAAIRGWMNRVAALTKLDELARQLLRGRNVRSKLLGVVTLGQLLDRLEWHRLCQIAHSEHPLLALAATQAIARIDPAQASATVVSLVIRHANWPAAKVASILDEIGPERLSEPLARALLQAHASRKPRLIPFLAVCHHSAALPAVRQILRESHADEIIAPCLQVIGKFRDHQDLPLVYRYLTHSRWHLRAIAAGCVGNMGRRADQEKLVPLLADPQWWVRYRAAQAIVGLSPQDEQRLRDLLDGLTDRYAKDILTQAIAERTPLTRPGTDRPPTDRVRMGSGP